MDIKKNIPLREHTTLKVGGPATFFVSVRSSQELQSALEWARASDVSVFLLGGGSNVLFSDTGFKGLIIHMDIQGLTYKGDDTVYATAHAGESWDSFVLDTVEKNLWGLENLSGIPGTVGASPIQNIGAYGTEVSEHIEYVDVFDMESLSSKRILSEACQFSYRDSLFKKPEGKRYAVMSVCFRLKKEARPLLSYSDVAAHFKNQRTPSGKEMREAILSIRAKKFPDLKLYGTAGSFFKNPIVSLKKARELKARYPKLPMYQMSDSKIKLSLAWILDNVLHLKNYTEGYVSLFERQPLVFVTNAGATAHDVVALMRKITERVHDSIGVVIMPEVTIVEKNN